MIKAPLIGMGAFSLRHRPKKEDSSSNGAVIKDSEEDNRERTTLLSHQYYIVCPCAIIVYIILQFLIGTVSNLGDKESEMSDRIYYFYNGAGFSFIISAIQQIVRILECRFQWGNKNSQGIYFTVFTVSSIAASSFILTTTLEWGGMCKDILGVESTAAQWAEWLVTVPLMVYMTLAMEDKESLTSHDIVIIAVFTIAISFGFLLNFKKMPLIIGYVLFILGCCSITVTIVLDRLSGAKFTHAINDSSTSHTDYRRVLIKASKRRTLSRLFLAVFPLFPLTHILAQAQLLDRDMTLIAYALCSLIAKLLFASSVSDAHMSLAEGVNKLRLSAELTANEKRRNFLRYVFHEVRVPLNTISMGLIVVKEDQSRLSDASKEAVAMMNGATNFMSDTLNDVLSMQRIEEGKMELVRKPFSMAALIIAATTAVKGCADAKKILMFVESELDLPMERGSYIGDRFRLEHVVVNFLSNAIKFSPESSKIIVKLTCKMLCGDGNASEMQEEGHIISKIKYLLSVPFQIASRHPEIHPQPMVPPGGFKVCPEPPTLCVVTLLVIDEGTGIAKRDLNRLFMPYCQIQADLLQQGKGTGLGLVLAKEIVSLHGGQVEVTSELGKGSTFGFSIPFELLPCVADSCTAIKSNVQELAYLDSTLESFLCVNTRPVELSDGSNAYSGAKKREQLCPLFRPCKGPTADSESKKADTLYMQKAVEKEANLKAGRTFLIVDGNTLPC